MTSEFHKELVGPVMPWNISRPAPLLPEPGNISANSGHGKRIKTFAVPDAGKNPSYPILLAPGNFIIGISGKPGAGKDMLAAYFVKYCRRFSRCSLGDIIRELTSAITGLSYERLFQHPGKDMPVEEYRGLTPRELTIQVGKCVEFAFGFHIWHLRLEQKIHQQGLTNVVVPDIRTHFQAQWVKDHENGVLIRIEGGRATHSPIECMLDRFNDFDIVINEEEWWENPLLVFRKICMELNLPIVQSMSKEASNAPVHNEEQSTEENTEDGAGRVTGTD